MSTLEWTTGQEVWRPIPSCPDYEASDAGRIRSLKSGTPRIKAVHPDPKGYLRFENWQGGRLRYKAVHVAVAEAHHGPRPDQGMHARHLNGNHLDSRAVNLRWGTPAENSQDTLRHGRNHNAAKTHCRQGHPYDEANTYRMGTERFCRACNRAAVQRSKMRRQVVSR